MRISYRMTLIVGFVNGISGLIAYGLLGNSAVVSVTSQVYGMSLSSFLISGVAFGSFLTNGFGMFQQYATPHHIEEIMLTPLDIREYLLMCALPAILTSIGSSTLFFIVASLLFELSFSFNVPLIMAVVSLGLVSSIGLGFIGLGFQLVYKQTSIVSWLLFSMTGLMGNMLVPVEVLPTPLRESSYLTPQYYYFTGIRVALGSDVARADFLLQTFAAYTCILLAVGVLSLSRSLKFVRVHGTHRWT